MLVLLTVQNDCQSTLTKFKKERFVDGVVYVASDFDARRCLDDCCAQDLGDPPPFREDFVDFFEPVRTQLREMHASKLVFLQWKSRLRWFSALASSTKKRPKNKFSGEKRKMKGTFRQELFRRSDRRPSERLHRRADQAVTCPAHRNPAGSGRRERGRARADRPVPAALRSIGCHPECG